jgi:hypothetical protein
MMALMECREFLIDIVVSWGRVEEAVSIEIIETHAQENKIRGETLCAFL